jgi:hypothetical protein
VEGKEREERVEEGGGESVEDRIVQWVEKKF